MSNPIWHFRTGKINGLERSRAQERRSAGPENKRNNNKSDGGSDRHQDKCRVIERHMAGCQVCPLLGFLSCSVFLFWWGEILSLSLLVLCCTTVAVKAKETSYRANRSLSRRRRFHCASVCVRTVSPLDRLAAHSSPVSVFVHVASIFISIACTVVRPTAARRAAFWH